MKNLLKNPILLLIVGTVLGWAITRIAVKKNWTIISGNSGLVIDCDTCFTPQTGAIPGSVGFTADSAEALFNGFVQLSNSLSNAVDSAGNPIWTINNYGGYMHKDLLKSLLGSLAKGEDRINYLFGVEPGSNMLRLLFFRGSNRCNVKTLNTEQLSFANFDLDVSPGDTSSSCPPNCFISLPPGWQPPWDTGAGGGADAGDSDSTQPDN